MAHRTAWCAYRLKNCSKVFGKQTEINCSTIRSGFPTTCCVEMSTVVRFEFITQNIIIIVFQNSFISLTRIVDRSVTWWEKPKQGRYWLGVKTCKYINSITVLREKIKLKKWKYSFRVESTVFFFTILSSCRIRSFVNYCCWTAVMYI